MDKNIWRKGYKIVTKKTHIQPVTRLTEEEQITLVNIIYLRHNSNKGDIFFFTQEELDEATRKLKTGKSPGPDGIGAELTKAVISAFNKKILDLLNTLIIEGNFPDIWKAD